MSDYDHGDALRFMMEADRWQKETKRLRAEVAELEAKWAAIPWAALESVPHVLRTHPGDHELEAQIIRDWLTANAPQEVSDGNRNVWAG